MLQVSVAGCPVRNGLGFVRLITGGTEIMKRKQKISINETQYRKLVYFHC